jgi:hypothetical protein
MAFDDEYDDQYEDVFEYAEKGPDDESLRVKEYGPPTASTAAEAVGMLFAQGCSTVEIVTHLIDKGLVEDEETAYTAVRDMYTGWTKIHDETKVETSDTRNWHIEMRHVLLKKTIDDNPRVALSVLESLAEIQKIHTAVDANLERIPLSIELIAHISEPKPTETPTEEGEAEDAVDTNEG